MEPTNIMENVSRENTMQDEKLIALTRYLEEAAERLKELDRQKDAFLDIAAHELKTPITSIQGFAQLLQDDSILADIEKSKHYLGLITHNSDRLYYLILNMIDAFKIINRNLKHNMESVNLYDLFESTKNRFEEEIISKGLMAKFHIEDHLPRIVSDQEKISRVLRNLLSNSLTYTESGTISLKIYYDTSEDENIIFEVKDTGKGIPKEHQEYLFTAFHQIDPALNRKTGGVGLGLFISKGLLESIGGKIWFESIENRGSTFMFSIPIDGAAESILGQDDESEGGLR